jgi:hypothetical protein
MNPQEHPRDIRARVNRNRAREAMDNIRGIHRDLYYTLHSEHINGGPAHDIPLTLVATPVIRPETPDYAYQQHLVTALRIGVISLVRLYARRFNTPPMSTAAIHAMPIFFFPTDVLFL